MTRKVLLVVGTTLFCIGGIGIIAGLVWLTASHVLGSFPRILDDRAELLLYLLASLLFVISLLGASFLAGALRGSEKDNRAPRHFRHHMRFHG